MIGTKWPRLVVVGEPVTEEQADEILIRTDNWWLTINDREWQAVVERLAHDVAGMPIEPSQSLRGDERAAAFSEYHRSLREWRERIGVLDLGYLGNARIASSWIGGAHGWCDWDGRIGCSSHNIGKWPSDGEVTSDWKAISEAFPYLDLTAQCIEDEGEGGLAAQWRVKDGAVEYDGEPTEPLARRLDEPFLLRCLMPGGERGVSFGRLRQALERVASR